MRGYGDCIADTVLVGIDCRGKGAVFQTSALSTLFTGGLQHHRLDKNDSQTKAFSDMLTDVPTAAPVQRGHGYHNGTQNRTFLYSVSNTLPSRATETLLRVTSSGWKVQSASVRWRAISARA
jgi:hypothetical protein